MTDSISYDSKSGAERYRRVSLWVAVLLALLLLLLAWMGAFKCMSCSNDNASAVASTTATTPAIATATAPPLPAASPAAASEPAAVPVASAAAIAAPEVVCGPITDVAVAFSTGSTQLAPEGKAQLRGVVKCIKGPTEVAGHSDSVGSEALNLRLSAARAEAVKRFLVASGVSASLLTTKGYGPSQPVADNATEAGRAKNRRISLVAK